MHTDDTLKILDQVTVRIGAEFRAFADKTCPVFDTRELKREAAARRRRQLKKAEAQPELKEHRPTANTSTTRKQFRIRSSKHHSLGDFGAMIRQFGTSDSFSTEPVSIRYSFAFFD
jgi:hypothetical protein